MPIITDPCALAPVGSYITDGRRLELVLECDASGVLCEDVRSELLLDLTSLELAAHWRFVQMSLR